MQVVWRTSLLVSGLEFTETPTGYSIRTKGYFIDILNEERNS